MLQVLADVQRRCGEAVAALEGLERALHILVGLQDDRCQGDTLFRLGQVHSELGDAERAVTALTRAAAIFERHRISSFEEECRALLSRLEPAIKAG